MVRPTALSELLILMLIFSLSGLRKPTVRPNSSSDVFILPFLNGPITYLSATRKILRLRSLTAMMRGPKQRAHRPLAMMMERWADILKYAVLDH